MTDNDEASSDFSDRHVRVKSSVGTVVVRDDREPLSEIEETANRLLDRAEELYEKHSQDSDGDGVYC